MAWQAAKDACSAKNDSTPVKGATWCLASMTLWENMMGTSGTGSAAALRDGFTSVGGTNMQSRGYWSSSELNNDSAWYYEFGGADWEEVFKSATNAIYVRACLAF